MESVEAVDRSFKDRDMRQDREQFDAEHLQQINKRLTLNLLIQGAAAHTFISASHLVRQELEELHPGLTWLYDRFAISGQLNYGMGDNALMFGRPNRWWGLSSCPQRPFRNHKLMARYGNGLAREELRHLKGLARSKQLTTVPILHWWQFMRLLMRVLHLEKGRETRLESLAVRAASEIWGIDPARLDASLTQDVAFGNLQTPRTWLGRMCRLGAIGYGGVERRNGKFTVVAKAWVFPLLVHELVKGTAELISLHGLNHLDEESYTCVTAEADQLEFEAWLLQAGPALWRRLLSVVPRDEPLAGTFMRLAKLRPEDLEHVLLQVIEQPEQARLHLASPAR